MPVFVKAVGALLFVAGVFGSGWSGVVFEVLQGESLPPVLTAQKSIHAAWIGVAALRVGGALLATMGAVLWTFASRRWAAAHRALAAGLIITALMTVLQQIAIWQGVLGYVIAAGFAAAAICVGAASRRGGQVLPWRSAA